MLSTAVFCLFGVNEMRLFLAGPDQRLAPGLADQFNHRFGLIGIEYVQRLFQLDHCSRRLSSVSLVHFS